MLGRRTRRLILKIHLYVGLAAAPILAATALSGSVLTFGSDIDRWLNRGLYRVAPQATRLTERELLTLVQNERSAGGAASAIARIEFDGDRGSQVFVTGSGARVFVNPYTAAVLGTREGPTAIENVLDAVFQFHVRLLAGNVGERLVDAATVLLVLLIPTGLVLWWKSKRLGFRPGANWRQLNWDLHNVMGVYAGGVLLVLALSGILLAWEPLLYRIVRAEPQRELPLPHSELRDDASGEHPGKAGMRTAPSGDVDAWLAAADQALPDQLTYQLILPITPRSPVQVTKHGSHGLGRSSVYVDRYDAHVLRVDDVTSGPRAFRAHGIDRAVHTGEIGGLPTRIVASLSSLALAVLVATGSVLWLKRIVP
jgi:uncharacterized iron-regulated membrane protein